MEQPHSQLEIDDAFGVREGLLGDAVGGDLVGSEEVAGPRVHRVEDRDDERFLPPVDTVLPWGRRGCIGNLHQSVLYWLVAVL